MKVVKIPNLFFSWYRFSQNFDRLGQKRSTLKLTNFEINKNDINSGYRMSNEEFWVAKNKLYIKMKTFKNNVS